MTNITPQQYLELNDDEQLKYIWAFTQRGLVYPAPHAIFATFWLRDESTYRRNQLAQLMLEVRNYIHCTESLRSHNSTAVVGTSFSLWRKFCQDDGLSVPKSIELHFPESDDKNTSEVFAKSDGVFQHSKGSLWFHIKSDKVADCSAIFEFIKNKLESIADKHIEQPASSRTEREDGKKGKVLGCRFSENLNNPSSPISLSKHSVCGTEDLEHIGASVALAQRFNINWEHLHSMSEEAIEDIIGRRTNDAIIPNRDQRSHIKSARMQDSNGNTTPVLRLGLPFGQSTNANKGRGSVLSEEQGIYFAGFAKNVQILENIMSQQIGSQSGFMNDRLLNHIKSDLGDFYYIPSRIDLGLHKRDNSNNFDRLLKQKRWDKFPGVDWERLDRHFEKASDNGLMYYNHKNYLYRMATMSDKQREAVCAFDAPTARILSLMENMFSLWQDNWYIDRAQLEMKGYINGSLTGKVEQGYGDIRDYIDHYNKQGNIDAPADIMKESVMIRKGWATRLQLHQVTSEEYGFRGRKVRYNNHLVPFCEHIQADKKDIVNGADTFRISPGEIIVGAMPNLSLGQGRYYIKYLTEQEYKNGFLDSLSEASGVGHNVPGLDKVLDKGLGGLISMLEAKRDAASDKVFGAAKYSAKDFYTASILSLQGVSEVCERFAALATKQASQLNGDQFREKQNLEAIAKRMNKLSTEKPDTLVEAVQLIFTVHSCLHLTGEPTALGRLDQLLVPFMKQSLSPEQIQSGEVEPDRDEQEIIDAFYIKLSEKVQSNRLNIEDHQPLGNLAMAGASGPYPQHTSVNQWVQQVTVGGTEANDDPAIDNPAYNQMTRMFIRASARLPLNAPCLSLRTRKDMPKYILEEAGKAILSGGAHPILLNDEKLIPSLHQSGNGVGGNELKNEFFDSKVSLKSARNYACDGCYEPQFPGENWFTLGGFSALQPLECAMNQGKTWSSAGAGYFYGSVVSFGSKPAAQIESFDELLDLYFEHFQYIDMKNQSGRLALFDSVSTYCPSPLLNVFIDDCVEKALDLYQGGAKYHIFGPCYIAIASTINSLFAIKKMVFDKNSAVTNLAELTRALSCDWGHKMVEPFVSAMAGELRATAEGERYKRLRDIALAQPRYGRAQGKGLPEEANATLASTNNIDVFGDLFLSRLAEASRNTFLEPVDRIKNQLEELAGKYGSHTDEQGDKLPFGIQIQPGVGTFENHVAMGSWNGASADGRRLGQTVASDLSAESSPADQPVQHQEAPLFDVVEQLTGQSREQKGAAYYANGAPTDMNIRECFSAEELVDVMAAFASGEGSNVLTITAGDPNSLTQAMSQPEKYDLLRNRTGGWTEFFTVMPPIVQEQHRRRPLSVERRKDN
ncbi:Dyp-type peroxidase [Marinomonas spartinae]|uniref:Dyp-type peroxidase n=1 Tax=Marinomonas spartinae TaxID=1792290 RepID=UPI0018F26239|nr:Dyp-type peroxidase [Marinomonas spartinae]MBJ7553418.1 Dyp-type peroxidase [Marinomonas spartinae]